MRHIMQKSILAIAGLSMVMATGCFSYHKTTTTEPPAQLAPASPPGESTTTSSTTTQSNDGSVREHSTTTYNP